MKFKASWRNQLWPLRVMRLWLGATWIYAGWDKASDPGFLTSGSPTFIGSQLAAYAQNSPIDFLLNKILDHPTQVGIFVMVAEFAIGFATLLWIAPTWAAFGGFVMSISLWLSSSWNVQPYFMASDSAYAILWLTYFLFLYGSRRKSNISIDRRGFIRVSSIAALAVVGVGLGRLFPKKAAAVSAGPAKIIEDSALAVGKIHNFTSNPDHLQFYLGAKQAFMHIRRCVPMKDAPCNTTQHQRICNVVAMVRSLAPKKMAKR